MRLQFKSIISYKSIYLTFKTKTMKKQKLVKITLGFLFLSFIVCSCTKDNDEKTSSSQYLPKIDISGTQDMIIIKSGVTGNMMIGGCSIQKMLKAYSIEYWKSEAMKKSKSTSQVVIQKNYNSSNTLIGYNTYSYSNGNIQSIYNYNASGQFTGARFYSYWTYGISNIAIYNSNFQMTSINIFGYYTNTGYLGLVVKYYPDYTKTYGFYYIFYSGSLISYLNEYDAQGNFYQKNDYSYDGYNRLVKITYGSGGASYRMFYYSSSGNVNRWNYGSYNNSSDIYYNKYTDYLDAEKYTNNKYMGYSIYYFNTSVTGNFDPTDPLNNLNFLSTQQ
jgi:hypothetical protein